ncbi:hypothetical protein T4E_7938 [Trichinella pseudospiralis]|uniref:Uncharacterized protein n=1 Tax=Trichinella pseudospiralis TaxID=6337 RepID=A0A0V0W9Z8_TRIPS|nr:hypothetical protein T4E_7938 [Trichinella pseudospiralis]
MIINISGIKSCTLPMLTCLPLQSYTFCDFLYGFW